MTEQEHLKNFESFKTENKHLGEMWSKMTKNELINLLYKDKLEISFRLRQLMTFMDGATLNMSNLNYTPDVISQLIKDRLRYEVEEFCNLTVDDASSFENIDEGRTYLINEVIESAKMFDGDIIFGDDIDTVDEETKIKLDRIEQWK